MSFVEELEEKRIETTKAELDNEGLTEAETEILLNAASLLVPHMNLVLPYAFRKLGRAYKEFFIARCSECGKKIQKFSFAGWPTTRWTYPLPEKCSECGGVWNVGGWIEGADW